MTPDEISSVLRDARRHGDMERIRYLRESGMTEAEFRRWHAVRTSWVLLGGVGVGSLLAGVVWAVVRG